MSEHLAYDVADQRARGLARGVPWSLPVQRTLAASAAADLLRGNERLHPDVALELIRTAPHMGALTESIGALPEDLALWPACLDRARALSTDPDPAMYLAGAGPAAHALDGALAQALTRARDEDTARAAAALLPETTGVGVAATAVALGVNLPTTAASLAPGYLIDWLTSPAAAVLTDDQVWTLLDQWAASTPFQPEVTVDLLAVSLLHRPALHVRATTSTRVHEAQALLADAGELADLAADGAGGRARALATLTRRASGPNQRILVPLRVAALATLPGWQPDQLDQLRAGYEESHAELVFGWASAPAAAALGLPFTPPAHVPQSWEDLRRPRHREVAEADLAMPVDHVRSHAHARAAGPLLAAELADPDPAVEAGRWLVALRLASGFDGSLADLAATATAVHAPPG